MGAFGQTRTPSDDVRSRRNADRFQSDGFVLDPNGGLQVNSDGTIGLKTGDGVDADSNGVKVDLATDPALEFDGGKLKLTDSVPRWRKYTVGHADLQAGSLENTIELFELPAAGTILAVKIKHTTAFAGSGITAYTVRVGVAGELDKYSSEFDVFQATGNAVNLIERTIGAEDQASATSVKLTAKSAGANLDQSSAGSVDVWVLWCVAE
jgi:hypothetical protein